MVPRKSIPGSQVLPTNAYVYLVVRVHHITPEDGQNRLSGNPAMRTPFRRSVEEGGSSTSAPFAMGALPEAAAHSWRKMCGSLEYAPLQSGVK